MPAELVERALAPNALEVAETRWCTPAEVEALPEVLESNLQFIREVGHGLASTATGH